MKTFGKTNFLAVIVVAVASSPLSAAIGSVTEANFYEVTADDVYDMQALIESSQKLLDNVKAEIIRLQAEIIKYTGWIANAKLIRDAAVDTNATIAHTVGSHNEYNEVIANIQRSLQSVQSRAPDPRTDSQEALAAHIQFLLSIQNDLRNQLNQIPWTLERDFELSRSKSSRLNESLGRIVVPSEPQRVIDAFKNMQSRLPLLMQVGQGHQATILDSFRLLRTTFVDISRKWRLDHMSHAAGAAGAAVDSALTLQNLNLLRQRFAETGIVQNLDRLWQKNAMTFFKQAGYYGARDANTKGLIACQAAREEVKSAGLCKENGQVNWCPPCDSSIEGDLGCLQNFWTQNRLKTMALDAAAPQAQQIEIICAKGTNKYLTTADKVRTDVEGLFLRDTANPAPSQRITGTILLFALNATNSPKLHNPAELPKIKSLVESYAVFNCTSNAPESPSEDNPPPENCADAGASALQKLTIVLNFYAKVVSNPSSFFQTNWSVIDRFSPATIKLMDDFVYNSVLIPSVNCQQAQNRPQYCSEG